MSADFYLFDNPVWIKYEEVLPVGIQALMYEKARNGNFHIESTVLLVQRYSISWILLALWVRRFIPVCRQIPIDFVLLLPVIGDGVAVAIQWYGYLLMILVSLKIAHKCLAALSSGRHLQSTVRAEVIGVYDDCRKSIVLGRAGRLPVLGYDHVTRLLTKPEIVIILRFFFGWVVETYSRFP